jgi:zinc transport system substrate-binding protein
MVRLPLLLLALAGTPAAAAPRVAVDIPPVASIAARVMAGLGVPEPILPPGASPHGHALRPSEAARLQDAEIVVWVGPALTPWLADPIDALASDAHLLTLAELPGLRLLGPRQGDRFAPHEHEHQHEHAPAAIDPHLWLDPINGATMATALAAALGQADPGNAETYAANARAFTAEMDTLAARIAEILAPARDRRFIVFHDAYQYFEHRFEVPAAASVALQDGVAPGAARVRELRELMRAEDVVCAFAEPQFEPRLLATLTEATDVRTATLDPLGAALAPGPSLYPELLTNLATSLATCLGPEG